MERKAWAIVSYGLLILFTLLLLILPTIDEKLLVGFLLLVTTASLLAILSQETAWDGTHWLALATVFIAAPFTILYFAVRVTGVTYVYGAILVLLSFTLIIVELAVGWRSSKLFNKLLRHGAKRPEKEEKKRDGEEADEFVVEPVTGKGVASGVRLVARKGSTTFHKASCGLIATAKPGDLIKVTAGEAEAYGLRPCKACKP